MCEAGQTQAVDEGSGRPQKLPGVDLNGKSTKTLFFNMGTMVVLRMAARWRFAGMWPAQGWAELKASGFDFQSTRAHLALWAGLEAL